MMRKRNSNTTITGKLRIKHLNSAQLENLIVNARRPRDRNKFANRLKILKADGGLLMD